jgi:hypothetical protein
LSYVNEVCRCALRAKRFRIEIVFTQMTKPNVSAARVGWNHVPNFDILIGHDHTLDQLPFLLKSSTRQAGLNSPAEILK